MSQELLWMPKGKDTGSIVLQCSIPYEGPEPTRIWTLLAETDEENPPALPITPVHGRNAFLEDKVHDWYIRNNVLKYMSRICEGHIWLLLEFKQRQYGKITRKMPKATNP